MLASPVITAPGIAHSTKTPISRVTDNIPAFRGTPEMASKQAPHLGHLQRDLNSPSASLRLRALKALKSPTKATYSSFDVPHAEVSIITAEERNPDPPQSLNDILQDIVVYVEVRTGNDNRSEGVKAIISKLGAKVNDRLLRNTTHVVFKDGLQSTYKRARSWNIPVVSILWIEACKVQRRLCEPEQFPISNIHIYEYPELFGKVSRVRCMQPDSELNKRPRKRQGTPTSSKSTETIKKSVSTPTVSTPKNDITRFFKPLSQNKQLAEDEAVESPATKLLNRITNGCFTPLTVHCQPFSSGAEKTKPTGFDSNCSSGTDKERPTAQKSLDFTQENRTVQERCSSLSVEPAKLLTPLRTSKRSSSLIDSTSISTGQKVQSEPRLTRRRSLLSLSQTASKEILEAEVQPNTQQEPPKTHRRNSLRTVAQHADITPESTPRQEAGISRRRSVPSISTMELSTPKLLKKPGFQSIAEEPTVNNVPEMQQYEMDVTPKTHKMTSAQNKTNYVVQSMDISTPKALLASKGPDRRTLCITGQMEISESNNENVNPYLCSNNESTIRTSQDSFKDCTPVPLFSSTRLPGSASNGNSNRRRTLFNVDMDMINDRINSINYNSQRRSLALANEAELGQCRVLAPLQAVDLNANDNKDQKSTEPKMRRLFTPNEEVTLPSSRSSSKSRRSSSSISSITSISSVKRRRTLATIKPTAAVGPIVQSNSENTAESDLDKEEDVTSFKSVSTAESGSESCGDCALPTAKRRIVNTLVHTNMHKDQVQIIHKTIRKLRGMRLDPTVTKRTTHLVSLEPRRTLNLLRGLMRGVWIVNYKWILDSMKAGKWVDEEKYEQTSFSRAVEICRTERQAFGPSYRCELFRFMETFYVSSLCQPIAFNNVKELLLLGSAKVTENRYKAKFVVGDKRRAEDDRIYISPLWVLDSITAMQIQKFGKYLMKSAIVTPHGIRYGDPQQDPDDKPRRNLMVCYKDPKLVINK